jgi:hypothetical protein
VPAGDRRTVGTVTSQVRSLSRPSAGNFGDGSIPADEADPVLLGLKDSELSRYRLHRVMHAVLKRDQCHNQSSRQL